MSLKNAGKNVFEKEDGALEAFRRYLELDEKSEATIRKYMHDVKVFLTFQKGKGSFRKEQIIGYKIGWRAVRGAQRKFHADCSESVSEICRGRGMLRQAVQAAVPDFL